MNALSYMFLLGWGTLHHRATGFPKWGRLVGRDNLGKMAKNCMKITKSAFLGQNSGGDMTKRDSQ